MLPLVSAPGEFDPDCNNNFDSKDPIVPHMYVHFRILLPVDKWLQTAVDIWTGRETVTYATLT